MNLINRTGLQLLVPDVPMAWNEWPNWKRVLWTVPLLLTLALTMDMLPAVVRWPMKRCGLTIPFVKGWLLWLAHAYPNSVEEYLL